MNLSGGPTGAHKPSRVASTCLRILVSILLLVAILLRTDWSTLADTFQLLSAGSILAVFCINLGAHFFLALRWRLALAGLRIAAPFSTVLRCYWLGLLYNLFLPSSIGGDVARSYCLFRTRGKPQIAGASSVADRWTGLMGLLLIAFAASLFLGAESSPSALRQWLLFALLSYLALSLALTVLGGPRFRFTGRREWTRSLFVLLRSVSTSLRLLSRRPILIAGAILATAAYYMAVIVTHIVLAADLGLRVPFLILAIYVPLIAIATVLPLTVNGIGLRELLYVNLFATTGWTQEASLTVSWVVFAAALLSGLPGLIIQLIPMKNDSLSIGESSSDAPMEVESSTFKA